MKMVLIVWALCAVYFLLLNRAGANIPKKNLDKHSGKE